MECKGNSTVTGCIRAKWLGAESGNLQHYFDLKIKCLSVLTFWNKCNNKQMTIASKLQLSTSELR